MNVVSITKGTDSLLKVPAAPVYLSTFGKKHYLKMGNILAKNQLLKDKFLPALEVYAEAMSQWQFAVSEIKKKNAKKLGEGYIQTYKSGAKNVSVEVTLRNDAEASLLKCFKIFGLDPKSEKELKGIGNPGQMDLFEELMKIKRAR
jgi:P27 family predicted phage terminase small subunit